jgi:hypothetical protein
MVVGSFEYVLKIPQNLHESFAAAVVARRVGFVAEAALWTRNVIDIGRPWGFAGRFGFVGLQAGSGAHRDANRAISTPK